MNLPKMITKIRLWFYLQRCDVYNIANQLNMLSDKKADILQQRNLVDMFDCYCRLGYKNVPKMKKRSKES